ncbi:MAG: recombinase family protein [Candidatus Heimdallarchaeota archaeon]|nr:recombinase family protein [Bdellovibrionales bacterium]MDH5646052.1 recombinase family protein [Candidatus Heimdallarchaeota archaeon]
MSKDLKRAVIYARVSTLDQKTIPYQVSELKTYLKNRGWSCESVFKEIGSGVKKLPKREEVLDLARKRKIDVILVWKLDRWGRSLKDVTNTLSELQELNVGFVSLTEALDFTTATGRAMAGLLSVFSEFERDLLRERIRAGLDLAKKKGVRIGRPPISKSKKQKVIRLFDKGLSKSEIGRRCGIDRRSVGRIIFS